MMDVAASKHSAMIGLVNGPRRGLGTTVVGSLKHKMTRLQFVRTLWCCRGDVGDSCTGQTVVSGRYVLQQPCVHKPQLCVCVCVCQTSLVPCHRLQESRRLHASVITSFL